MKWLVKRWTSKNKAKEWNIKLMCRDTVQKYSVKGGVRHELTAESKKTPNYCPSANWLSVKEGPSYFILLSWSAN